MIYSQILNGKQLYLRALDLNDCNDIYIGWMNDKETNMYMETRLHEHSLESVLTFINEINASNDSYSFAIVDNITHKHIGNIKLGKINKQYSNADISYFIGDKSFLNKGYATEAVILIVQFAFNNLNLHRVQAGVIDGNNASTRVLEKAGFVREGRLKEKFILNGNYTDHLLYGLIRGKK